MRLNQSAFKTLTYSTWCTCIKLCPPHHPFVLKSGGVYCRYGFLGTCACWWKQQVTSPVLKLDHAHISFAIMHAVKTKLHLKTHTYGRLDRTQCVEHAWGVNWNVSKGFTLLHYLTCSCHITSRYYQYFLHIFRCSEYPVSYTHLTLPTIYSV